MSTSLNSYAPAELLWTKTIQSGIYLHSYCHYSNSNRTRFAYVRRDYLKSLSNALEFISEYPEPAQKLLYFVRSMSRLWWDILEYLVSVALRYNIELSFEFYSCAVTCLCIIWYVLHLDSVQLSWIKKCFTF